jgi:rRNA maturation endonuclease Nob1
MPTCVECKKTVTSGLVIETGCYKKLLDAGKGQDYICDACKNEVHPANAKYCKICGTEIKK